MTKEARTTARAIVTVTLEIDVEGTWGGDCPTSQVYQQALDGAARDLRIAMGGEDGTMSAEAIARVRKRIAVIGTRNVRVVLTEGPTS
jgi:hypothetical protein